MFAWVLLFATILLVIVHYHIAESRRKNLFKSRKIIPFELWCKEFYTIEHSYQLDLMVSVLEVFAREIGIHITQLRPSDRLDQALGLSNVMLDDSSDLYVLSLQELAKRHSIRIAPDSNWKTLDDVLRSVVGCQPAKNTGPCPELGRG